MYVRESTYSCVVSSYYIHARPESKFIYILTDIFGKVWTKPVKNIGKGKEESDICVYLNMCTYIHLRSWIMGPWVLVHNFGSSTSS